MNSIALVELEHLVAKREDEAEDDARRALSWGKRKNWCDKAARLAAALLAGGAAVLAVVAVSKAWTASVAGASAAIGGLVTLNFARDAAVDYTAAAEYKRLASRYEMLQAELFALDPNDAMNRLEHLASEKERIQKRHAAATGT